MKKLIFLVVLACSISGCNQMTPEEEIQNLNGYWEIKTVQPKKGQIKEFRFNEMIDYIYIENTEGYRKKVRPQLDGKYLASEDLEVFSAKIENDSIILHYETPYDSWKETLLSSEEDEVKMLNRNGTIYTYKRFTPYLTGDYDEEE